MILIVYNETLVNAVELYFPFLRPPRGSVKLISTKFTNPVPVEQFHHKPMGFYDGGPLKLGFVDLVEVSCTDPRGGLKKICSKYEKSKEHHVQFRLPLCRPPYV